MTAFAVQALTDGASRLMIDGGMSIYNAQEVKEQLLAAVRTAQTLELDLSSVNDMDTAGFQLLVLAKRECQRLDRVLRITAHSDTVREFIDFYNMGAFFGDPVVILAEHKE